MEQHLAELLLDIKLRGQEDRFRKKHPFSEDIAATNAVLFNRAYPRLRKIRAYRKWLENNQPCVFGRVAAKNERLFICLLEERDILTLTPLRTTLTSGRRIRGLNRTFWAWHGWWNCGRACRGISGRCCGFWRGGRGGRSTMC